MPYWTPRVDTAWFFTAGKAWMEGMTPYIDFADSKGPLLWLIYGIGYLLSPTTYHGVFWLSVMAYTVTFELLWRTARLFSTRRNAAIVLGVMPLLLFSRAFHYEVRAEDFCMPWVCASLYCTIQTLHWADKKKISTSCTDSNAKTLNKYAFWLGVGMAWGLLVKWNMFFMMSGMALVVAGVAIANKQPSAIVGGLIGIILPVIPFAIYLMATGTFDSMIKEYFINTFLITDHGSGKGMWTAVIINNLTNLRTTFKTLALFAIMIGMYWFCRQQNMSKWLLLAFIPFFLFLELKAPWPYYMASAMPFFIFMLIECTNKVSKNISKLSKPQYLIILTTICLLTTISNIRASRFTFRGAKQSPKEMAIEKILLQKPYCKIMYRHHDIGWGISARALPACKYWAEQNGATQEMKEDRQNAIRLRKADFYIDESIKSDMQDLLLSSGYRQCRQPITINGKRVMKTLTIYERK